MFLIGLNKSLLLSDSADLVVVGITILSQFSCIPPQSNKGVVQSSASVHFEILHPFPLSLSSTEFSHMSASLPHSL